jgi:hypothetical protein
LLISAFYFPNFCVSLETAQRNCHPADAGAHRTQPPVADLGQVLPVISAFCFQNFSFCFMTLHPQALVDPGAIVGA